MAQVRAALLAWVLRWKFCRGWSLPHTGFVREQETDLCGYKPLRFRHYLSPWQNRKQLHGCVHQIRQGTWKSFEPCVSLHETEWWCWYFSWVPVHIIMKCHLVMLRLLWFQWMKTQTFESEGLSDPGFIIAWLWAVSSCFWGLSFTMCKMRDLCDFHDFQGRFQLWCCVFRSLPPSFSGLESLSCQVCGFWRHVALWKGSCGWRTNGFNQKGRRLPHKDMTVSKKSYSSKLHSRKWMELSVGVRMV